MADTSSKGRPAGTQSARGAGNRAPEEAAPAPGPEPSAAPPGQAPEAAATSEAAAAPPADHAADPPPPAPGQDSQPGGAAPPASPDQPGSEPAGGDTAVQAGDGPVTAAGGVRGGRLADLGQPAAMPEGVPYAVAREALYVGNPDAAAAAARAFNPGDRVPAELVEKFGWHDLVQIPEWAAAPPAPATETSEEQN